MTQTFAALVAGIVFFSSAAMAQGVTPLVTPAPAAEAAATGLPDWLNISGEARMRYESVDGQFRAGGRGGDQALALRTLVLAEARFDKVNLGFEVQDSRHFYDDAGSPTSNSAVNALDILQFYANFDASQTGIAKVLGHNQARLKLGRQTLDIGSRRILERVDMSNVILNFTGGYWNSTNARGDMFHALAVVPVGRLPTDFASLQKDEIQLDKEEWSRVFLGLHYIRANVLADLLSRTNLELFVYQLSEKDSAKVATPNRDYLQPGFRLIRPPRRGQWDFEFETAYRTGTRRASSAATDVTDLKVRAGMAHVHLGYTFDAPWQPRLALDWDYATGDSNPNDAKFDQFERLFGGRRTDFGHTGIYGPLAPANINAPGWRLEVRPNARWDSRLTYKAAFLDQARDAWVIAQVRDRQGQSGKFIGHSWDWRARYWIDPGKLQLEVGAATLIQGRFAKTAPNASRQGNSNYGFVALTRTF